MIKKLFPNDKVVIKENFDVLQDWEVPIPGFLIVACKRKIKSIMEFNQAETEEFLPLVIKLRKALKEVQNIDYVYLFQAEDTRHELFHLWIFPRYAWMEEKFGKRIESVRPIIEYAKAHMSDDKNVQEIKNITRKLKKAVEN
jgi:diadenosine tetraphosphate (Ap4A) HIT family hydrolase